MIKAILIDIDNTLLDFDASARLAIEEGFAKRGIDFSDNVIDVFHRINNSLWKRLENGELTKQGLFDIRWNTIFEALGVKADGIEFEAYFRAYLFDSAVQMDGALDLLKYLASKYDVYAASNGTHAQQINRLTRAGMIDMLKNVFTSQALGVQKPEKEFFHKCLEQMNCAPQEVMMIGDSLSADIGGAKNAGLMTCWFDVKKTSNGNSIADHTVTELNDIKQIL
ncbi:MAG: noncanonical pyrimidine nucleotidase, YjjG family [Clostridiales bacterium]|nr:noncanonical pyrimidine nucleotidase, YjjG family [Clostridiales bacterium]